MRTIWSKVILWGLIYSLLRKYQIFVVLQRALGELSGVVGKFPL